MRRSTSSRSARATARAPRRTRMSTASRARMPRTTRCSRTTSIDAVYIALPNALHHEWTMRALDGRQARHLREAVHAPSERGGRGAARSRAQRSRAHRGIHVAPLATDGASPRAAAAGGRAARRTRDLHRERSRVSTTSAGCATSAAARCSISAATASVPRGSSLGQSRTACTVRRSSATVRSTGVRRNAAVRQRDRDVPVQPARTAREHDRGDRAPTACCACRTRSSTRRASSSLNGEEHHVSREATTTATSSTTSAPRSAASIRR